MCLQSIAFGQTTSETALSSQAPPQAIQKLEINVIDQGFTSSSKIVITAEDIKKSQINNLAVLLATKANITISQSSFQPNSIFIRGGDSSHVLFLIDGIPFYDAASVQRTINLSSLNLRNIKRIEVIKGSQSVLFGGQALSGVIKIETFPKEIATTGDIVLQNGKNFAENLASLQYKINDTSALATSIKYLSQNNKSPKDESTKTYSQEIAAFDLSYLLRPNDSKIEYVIKGQFSDDKSQIASTSFTNFQSIDTDNFYTTNQSYAFSAVARSESVFNISFSRQIVDRTFFQEAEFDIFTNTRTDEKYTGSLDSIRAEAYAINNNTVSVLLGLSFINEALLYKSLGAVTGDDTKHYQGVYIKNNLVIDDNLVIEAGYRKEFSLIRGQDEVKKLDDLNYLSQTLSDTYQVGVSLFKVLKLEFSTGFKTPSLFQLYSSYGNPNLKPEKVKTYSAALESQLTEDILASLTVFDTRFSNLIIARGAPPNQRYENVSETHTRGVEGFLGFFIPTANLGLQFSAGYQEPEDLSQGKWLVKRPLRTASIKANLGLGDQVDLGLEAIHTGSRRDRTATAFVTLSSYTLLHATLNVQINSELSTFVRAENITDTQYQPSFGYYIDGVVARVGLNYRF